MSLKINRVGQEYITNEGCKISIIQYYDSKNSTIQFECGYIKKNISFNNIKKGNIKNPYHKSVVDIGFLGEGAFKTRVFGKITTCYSIWASMIERCYDAEYNIKKPTYIGCSVDERWHNFQNFARWWEDNWKTYMQGWHLDKDILVKGNKIYSPETCCFVPREVNGIFVNRKTKKDKLPCGVHKNRNKFQARMNLYGNYVCIGTFSTPKEAFQAYKVAKEELIKELSDKWKGLIDPRVYEVMYQYKV